MLGALGGPSLIRPGPSCFPSILLPYKILKQSDKDLSYHVNDEMFDDKTMAV